MKFCYYKNHEKIRTTSASELFSQKEFYIKFEDDGDYYSYYPIKPEFVDTELINFVEHNKDCVAKMCNKVFDSGCDWNPPRECVIVIARDDKIVEEFSLDYLRGYRDAWMCVKE